MPSPSKFSGAGSDAGSSRAGASRLSEPVGGKGDKKGTPVNSAKSNYDLADKKLQDVMDVREKLLQKKFEAEKLAKKAKDAEKKKRK